MATGGVASFEALRFAPSSVPSYSKCLPSPKRMINRCSDFIYRAPVSLIKKPCYDRIYGLSRTMRCFMIQGGFMLMIRSGLPSGPLSGHLSAPSAPAALDTPIFLAPRPIHRLLVHLHFEIVTSRRQCAGKKLQAQDPIRTEAFGEGRIAEWKKEEAALTGLDFSRTPHPQCLQTLSALIRFVSCTATPGRPSSFTDTHAYGLFVQSIQTSQ